MRATQYLVIKAPVICEFGSPRRAADKAVSLFETFTDNIHTVTFKLKLQYSILAKNEYSTLYLLFTLRGKIQNQHYLTSVVCSHTTTVQVKSGIQILYFRASSLRTLTISSTIGRLAVLRTITKHYAYAAEGWKVAGHASLDRAN